VQGFSKQCLIRLVTALKRINTNILDELLGQHLPCDYCAILAPHFFNIRPILANFTRRKEEKWATGSNPAASV
jgi:hypothetical protein